MNEEEKLEAHWDQAVDEAKKTLVENLKEKLDIERTLWFGKVTEDGDA